MSKEFNIDYTKNLHSVLF